MWHYQRQKGNSQNDAKTENLKVEEKLCWLDFSWCIPVPKLYVVKLSDSITPEEESLNGEGLDIRS